MRNRGNLDKLERRLISGSFAGWKLDVIEAMVSDDKLIPSDVRVGIALVQHLNGRTFKAFPSHAKIALASRMSPRNVIKCLERLRATGWLQWARGDQQSANTYVFNPQVVADEIARAKEEKERWKQRKGMNSGSYPKAGSGGTTVHTPLRTTGHTNTLNRTQASRGRAVP